MMVGMMAVGKAVTFRSTKYLRGKVIERRKSARGGRICSARRNSVLRTQPKNTLNNCPVLGFNADKTYPIVKLALELWLAGRTKKNTETKIDSAAAPPPPTPPPDAAGHRRCIQTSPSTSAITPPPTAAAPHCPQPPLGIIIYCHHVDGHAKLRTQEPSQPWGQPPATSPTSVSRVTWGPSQVIQIPQRIPQRIPPGCKGSHKESTKDCRWSAAI